MRVLALSVSAGTGHGKAAKAVQDCFDNNYKNVEFKIIDTLKYINPLINKLVVGSYLQAVRKKPGLYSKLYDYAENEDTLATFSGIVNDFLSIKLKNLIDRYCPDVILCTHPFPLEMLSILKRKKKISIPVVAILTDYAVHSFWLYDYIDAYIVPHEDFIQEFIERGISKETIYPYGIPISQKFFKSIDKASSKMALGLDANKITLLMMGGGLGIGNMKTIFETISFSSLDVQLIACTGSNKLLKNQLEDIKNRSHKTSLIYEYTDNVSTLMSISDLLISKPGGLTITEALNKHLPIVITSAIPGQEERNADYLLNNGIAARVKDNDSVISIIKQIVGSPNRLEFMKKTAKEKSKPNSAKDVCELLISLSENHNALSCK